jgi:hypothetical protein
MIDEKKQNVWSGEKEASFLRWILEKENRCPLTTCPVTVPGDFYKLPPGVDQVIWNGKTVGPKPEPGPMGNIAKGMERREGEF